MAEKFQPLIEWLKNETQGVVMDGMFSSPACFCGFKCFIHSLTFPLPVCSHNLEPTRH